MKEIVADPQLIAYCGLYCGACKKYLSGGCPGCRENVKASWCKIRSCNMEHQFQSCASCTEFLEPNDCKKFNNFIGKIFGLIFRSDRRACILRIRETGPQAFAEEMAAARMQTIRRS
jgi:hypothetical protein